MSYRSPTPIYTCDRCGAGAEASAETGHPPKEWRRITTNSHSYQYDRFGHCSRVYDDQKHYDICPDCMKSLEKWLTLKQ